MEKLRIQKYLSECGVMSRRAAEREIGLGTILINNEKATLGQSIDPAKDVVLYQGKRVQKARSAHPVYVMLNKPRGYVTTLSDEKGRKCVTDLVKEVETRIYPIGRLDINSEGLLLLTNDGELTNQLTHPSHHIPKIYQVRVTGQITSEQVKRLNESMLIDDYEILPVETIVVTKDEEATTLRMVLYEGRNRQIRKMCDLVGLQITRLRRIAIGNIDLPRMKSGEWRYLTKEEIEYLKNSVKEK